MKLAYEAPEIIYEDFSLSSSIAAGCEFKTSLQVEDSCGLPMEGDVFFTGDITGCQTIVPPGFNTICYHNPTDENSLYTS